MTDIQVIFDKSASMLSFGNSTRDQLYNLVQDQIKLAEENKQEINISIKDSINNRLHMLILKMFCL